MSAQETTKAFNLIVEGCGYLNRIRGVTPKKGLAYLACTINAMMGESDSVEYVSIDCRVVGKQALAALELLAGSVNAKHKVIVGFRAGDPKPDVYEFEYNGETRKVEGFKARLLQLTFAKVNGERFDIPLVDRPKAPAEDVKTDGQASALRESEAVEA